MADQILKETAKILPVPYSAAMEFGEQSNLIKEEVDRVLTARYDINELIGQKPLSDMYANHENHAAFMSNVFKLNDYELMCQVIIWVYHTYHAQSFSFDYFPIALKVWIEAIQKQMEPTQAEPVLEIYRWIIKNHEMFIDASQSIEALPLLIDQEWLKIDRKSVV